MISQKSLFGFGNTPESGWFNYLHGEIYTLFKKIQFLHWKRGDQFVSAETGQKEWFIHLPKNLKQINLPKNL